MQKAASILGGLHPGSPEKLHQLLVPVLCPVFSPQSSQLRLSLSQGFRKTFSENPPPLHVFYVKKGPNTGGRDEVEGEEDPGSHTLMANNLFLILKTFTGR